VFVPLLLLTGCADVATIDLSTDTKSADLATEAEQIEFLGRYLNLNSAVLQTPNKKGSA
jgi:hypothetical protein